MSELKSAWELSLEKSNEMVPEANRTLTEDQKKEIGEIRKEYQARIADMEITLQHKINRLPGRVPPEEISPQTGEFRKKFAGDKERLQQEMESKVEAVYNRK